VHTTDLLRLVEDIELNPQLFSDNIHIYCFLFFDGTALEDGATACVEDVAKWMMRSNGLQLNATRPRCCGARRAVVNTNCLQFLFWWALCPWCPSRNRKIWTLTSTPTSPWENTFPERFVVFPRYALVSQHSSVRQQTSVAVSGQVACFVAVDMAIPHTSQCPNLYQPNRLEAVLDVAARLVYRASRCNHVTTFAGLSLVKSSGTYQPPSSGRNLYIGVWMA